MSIPAETKTLERLRERARKKKEELSHVLDMTEDDDLICCWLVGIERAG